MVAPKYVRTASQLRILLVFDVGLLGEENVSVFHLQSGLANRCYPNRRPRSCSMDVPIALLLYIREYEKWESLPPLIFLHVNTNLTNLTR